MKKKNDSVAASYVAAVEYAYRFRKQTERSIKASEKVAITPILSELKNSVPPTLRAFCEAVFYFDVRYLESSKGKKSLYALFAQCMNPEDCTHAEHHFARIAMSKEIVRASGFPSTEDLRAEIPTLSQAWRSFLRVRLKKESGGSYFLYVEIPFAKMEAEAPKELRLALKILRKEKL